MTETLKVIDGMQHCEYCECDGCPYRDREHCDTDLFRDAISYIKAVHAKASEDATAINKLMLDKETLEEMLEQKYTKKQLVQAVNDILDDTVTEDLGSTSQSVCAFLRLIDADGYFAILPDGTAEIRLNEE